MIKGSIPSLHPPTSDSVLFLEALSKELNKDQLLTDQNALKSYTNNPGHFNREVSGVLFPHSVEDVQCIVRTANTFKVPLYPLSTGKNWGLGSKLPVTDGCFVVELSRMNKIHEVDSTHGYVVIEPGVTQGQLYDFLRQEDLPFVFNVTGSGLTTSVLGNALDRGVGYFSSKVPDIYSLEVVLPDGSLLKTGFGHFENSKISHLYPYGVGPDLSGLFFQSNLGIIVRAGFGLLPKREVHATLIAGLKDKHQLEHFINELATLRKQGLIQTAVHIANKERGNVTFTPNLVKIISEEEKLPLNEAKDRALQIVDRESKNEWTAIAGVLGSKRQVKESFRQSKRRLSSFGQVVLLTQKKINAFKRIARLLSFISFFKRKSLIAQCMEPVVHHSHGVPSNIALRSIYWPQNEIPKDEHKPEETNSGLIFSTPILPMEGKAVTKCVEIIHNTFNEYGFSSYITFNMLNDRSLEGVINLVFDKRDSQRVVQAKQCIRKLNEHLLEEGFILYRSGIDYMDQLIDPNDIFWQTAKAIKDTLDPNGIISPGRYSIPTHHN